MALSYRLELASKGQPENAYNRRLNTVNAIVCLIIVAIVAAEEISFGKGQNKAGDIAFDITLLSLVASCIVLVWAIYRLVRISKSTSGKMVNKVMIGMNIFVFLLIIIITVLISATPASDLRASETLFICSIIVYSVSNTIFGLIVN